METGKPNIKEYTMGFGEANILAMLIMFPLAIVLITPFALIWDLETLALGKDVIFDYFFYIFLGGIVVHELLHGITWAYFAPQHFKSIKFGVKMLTPYCHCKTPLKVKHYRLGGAMPLFVMGLLPALVGIVFGDGAILLFGVLFTLAAGGDILILYMMRKLDKDIYVSDHPSKVGFYIELEDSADAASQAT